MLEYARLTTATHVKPITSKNVKVVQMATYLHLLECVKRNVPLINVLNVNQETMLNAANAKMDTS